MEKGKRVLPDILEPKRVEVMHMDLSSFASIRACAKEFLSKCQKLNILINNGGVMRTPESRTVDGFETQFATNHLEHFLLFNLLKPLLLASATPEFHSRVVTVTSAGHRMSQIHFDNINLENGEYQPGIAYAQSKTANIYMMNEIQRRYGSQGLHGLSVHPGGIFTGLQKNVDEQTMEIWHTNPEIQHIMKSPAQGAATTVLAAIGKEFEDRGALYLEDCRVGEPVKEGYRMFDPGYAPHAFNEENEKKLWALSLAMVGLNE